LKEKEKISHRGKALRKAKQVLEDWKSHLVLGLTGSIGSGKSTVARMFQELGAEIIDADKVGHQLLEKREVKESIVKNFGSFILNKEGRIERRKVGRIVFQDRKRLEELDSIIHPLIFAEIKRKITFSQARIIIVDAAILLEAGWNSLVDRVIVVGASYETGRKRVEENGLLSSKEVEGIIEAQFAQNEKIQKADFLIENEESIQETKRQVERVWRKLVAGC
jgi:dephospho-CoA kinase